MQVYYTLTFNKHNMLRFKQMLYENKKKQF